MLAGSLAGALALAGCGVAGEPEPAPSTVATPLTLAAPESTEARIAAHVYAGALRDAGFKAAVAVESGERDAYLAEVEGGDVDVVVDYTGSLLTRYDGAAEATDPGDVAAALREALPESTELLDPAEADRSPVLVTTRARSVSAELGALSDLGEACSELTFAGPPEFAAEDQDLPRLAEELACTPKTYAAKGDPAEILSALLTDAAQIAVLPRTDPEIARNGLVVLDDPRHFFRAQQIAPLVHADTVPDEAREALGRVSEELTTEEMLRLNGQTLGDAPLTPRQAAEIWLAEHGFGS
ncbi:glycine betaine ABC transporter substrate-binding protein [Zhihengliuella sp.]|uniref:glycine betaine ABC transporter substrate-binding protein n=1 Tax=Zhihengliuella sp. TaxID=1954483 RepID=UPI002811B847|nr:glycine betaine ABC transporter substrate-binding protein [Zhihengliuella sp.]